MKDRYLIDEARGFIAGCDPTDERTALIRDLADALEAHTSTDDEREARLEYVIDAAVPVDEFPSWRFRYSRRIAEAVRAAGFHRSEVPEPSAALAAIERAIFVTGAEWARSVVEVPETSACLIEHPITGARCSLPAEPRHAHVCDLPAGPRAEPSDAAADAAQIAFHEFTFGPDPDFLTPKRLEAGRAAWKAALAAGGGR